MGEGKERERDRARERAMGGLPLLSYLLIDPFDIFTPCSTVFTYLSVGVVVGQTSSMTPDYTKAKVAAQKVFTLINSVPSIDNQSDQGLKLVSTISVW
jgi:hypothetical protein